MQDSVQTCVVLLLKAFAQLSVDLSLPPKKKESEIPTTIIPTRVDSDIFQLVNYPTSSPIPILFVLPALVVASSGFNQTLGLVADT